MLSDGPPSREAVTISRTCRESTDVNTLTSSGMIAPASVPQVMIVDNFHHIVVLPARVGMSIFEAKYVTAIEMNDVSQTSVVSGGLMLKAIFMRSEPMSAILVKMPPAIRSAAAPRDSPIAKPMKHGPA